MQIWMTLILAVQLLTALTMIGLVLIQHGKGADMGASFGGGSSGSLFGATGSANFLSRSTAACATVFFVCTLALAAGANFGGAARSEGGSVLDRAAPSASAAKANDAIPGAAGAAATTAGQPALPAAAPANPAVPAAVGGSAPAPALPATPAKPSPAAPQ